MPIEFGNDFSSFCFIFKYCKLTKFSIDSDYLIDLINKIVDPKDKIAYLGKLHLQNSEKYNKLFDDFDYIDDCVQNLQKPGQMEKTIKTLKEIKKEYMSTLPEKFMKVDTDYDVIKNINFATGISIFLNFNF